MTIEKSPPSTEAKPSASSQAKGAEAAKGKSGKTEGADAGGFMAILATVDAGAAPSLVADSSSSSCLGPPDAMAVPTPQVLNPVDISTAQTATDAAALLAQAAQLLPTPPPTAREMTASEMTAQSAGTQAVNALGRPAKMLADATTPVASPVNQAADAPAPSLSLRKPTKAQPDLGAAGQLATSATATASSGSNTAAESRAAQVALKAQTMSVATVVPPALLASVVNSVRREDEGRERSAFKSAATEGVPGAGATTATTSTGASVPSLSPPAAAASPTDLYVAEQVKYWISNDVKNAEMKLDGIGNNPVEVSISMQGNEAHVAFRSDESQARDVLEAASSHLKDLLQREGLVLSGVSVGTTGSGDASQQERREKQGAREMRAIAATQSATSQGASNATRTSGRALDLFV